MVLPGCSAHRVFPLTAAGFLRYAIVGGRGPFIYDSTRLPSQELEKGIQAVEPYLFVRAGALESRPPDGLVIAAHAPQA